MNLFVGTSALVLGRPPLFGIMSLPRKEQGAPSSPSTCSQLLKCGPFPDWSFVSGAHSEVIQVVYVEG